MTVGELGANKKEGDQTGQSTGHGDRVQGVGGRGRYSNLIIMNQTSMSRGYIE